MSTFLQLCQAVAEETRMVAPDLLTAVAAQTGQKGNIVNATARAWTYIQNLEANWKWMRADFSKSITSGDGTYTASDWSLTRWRRWITGDRAVSMYLTATGVADEGALAWLDWEDFRLMYLRGSQSNSRPRHYTVSPLGTLYFGPVPDASYTVNGEYMKSNQSLAADADTPEMPADHHMLIVWRAVIALNGVEGSEQVEIAHANYQYSELLGNLRRDQLPSPMVGEALA